MVVSSGNVVWGMEEECSATTSLRRVGLVSEAGKHFLKNLLLGSTLHECVMEESRFLSLEKLQNGAPIVCQYR